MSSDQRRINRSEKAKLIQILQLLGKIATITVICLGCVVILGWTFKIAILKSVIPGTVSMKSSTAIALILSAIALNIWQQVYQRNSPNPTRSYCLIYSCLFLVLIIALVTLIQYTFQLNLGIDQLIFKVAPDSVDAAAKGKMAPNTAISFLLIALALLLLIKRIYRPAHCFAIITFLIAFVALTGHAYHLIFFYGIGSPTGMAIHTAISFICLSLGILFTVPEKGVMKLLISQNAGGVALRNLLPVTILFPTLLGWLLLIIFQDQIATNSWIIALFSVGNVIVFSLILWLNANKLDRLDLQRDRYFQELVESEDKFRAIFNQTFQFIGLLKPDGTILEVNQTALEFSGVAKKDVIGKPFWEPRWWIPDTETEQQLRNAIALAARGEFIRYEVDVRSKENQVITIDFSLKPISDENGEVILLVPEGRDISKHKQAEKALANFTKELENRVRERTTELAATNKSLRRELRLRQRAETILRGQNKILERIAWDLPLSETLAAITTLIESQAEQALCTILLLDETKTILHYAAAESLPADFKKFMANGLVIGENVGSCGTAAYRGEPVIVTDIASDPLWRDYRDYALQFGLHACWSIPIWNSKSEVIGTFAIYYPTPRSPSKNDWELIELSTGLAAVAIETKQNQQALAASEERFRQAIVNAPFPVVIHAENGKILQINRVWTELTGYTPEDLPTIAEWTEKAYGERQEIVRSQIDRLYDLNERIDEGEFTITTASGDKRIWDFSSAPLGILPNNGRMVISMAMDITQRKQAQLALAQSEASLRRLVEANIIGVFFANLSGTIFDANDAFLNLIGYTREDLAAGELSWIKLTPPEYSSQDREQNQKLAETGVSDTIEKEYIRKDGSRVPVLVGVAAIAAEEENYGVCFVVDLSDRVRAEQALQLRLKQQAAVGDLSQLALLGMDLDVVFACATDLVAKNLHVEYCKVLQLLPDGNSLLLRSGVGWQPGLVGQATVGTDLDSQAGYTLLSHEPVVVEDLRTETRFSGPPLLREHRVISGMSVIISGKNRPFGILGAHTTSHRQFSHEDINFLQLIANVLATAIERHQAETEIQQLNASLEARVQQRTQQLEELNQELAAFAYSVSHDLRAPLRAMQGFSIALLEDYGDRLDELGQNYAHRIVNAAARMDNLIQDLLAYSRLGRTDIKLQRVNLQVAIAQVLSELESELQAQQAQVKVEQPLGFVIANSRILQQILLNLLTNALKFVPPEVPPQVRIRTEEKNDRLYLWVEDNGIGIAPEHQERIFRVFERLHGVETYPGTGIGLAIVRKGIERLGGSCGVKSILGQGSRFWLSLPKSEKNQQ
ncbi:PAS domain S-box protein [Oscillatoria salina]|uniref:PAS domain S-box protein n=1 Tax=Oscillatoria salina TaxID=331517 RepID=UPI001CCC1E07|nr:PAS domain S-box protein [Oscillatoria salina]MBZ8179142.1 PAS domain S-box protein [Oscillatoria salina IIICB1]